MSLVLNSVLVKLELFKGLIRTTESFKCHFCHLTTKTEFGIFGSWVNNTEFLTFMVKACKGKLKA